MHVVRKLKRASILVLLSAVFLLAVGCTGPSLPGSERATPPSGAAQTSEPAPHEDGSQSENYALSSSGKLQETLDNGIWFDRISLEEGLSQSVVMSILQDRRGFMWFATQDGLNRYDGYEFRVYKHDPDNPNTVSDGFVNALLEDEAGALWIGTNGGGLDRLDPEKGEFRHYRHDSNDPTSLGNDVVASLCVGQEGDLWVGTQGGGLSRFDPITEQFTNHKHDSTNPDSLSDGSVQVVYQDREGTLWVGTDDGGLNRLDPGSSSFRHYVNDPEDPNSLSNNDVQEIYQDSQGVLWVGTTGGGLERFDPRTEQFSHYQHDSSDPHSLSHNSVQVIYEDRAGELWIGTNGGGLERFDRETERFIHHTNDPSDPHSLSVDQVWSLYVDRGGMLWAGTFGGGLNKHDPTRQKFVHYQANRDDPNGLSSNVIWSILEDTGQVLWIGTNGAGLNRFDRVAGTIVHYRNDPGNPDSLSDDTVWSLLRARDGQLWAGTSAGLDRFDRQAETFSHYSSAPIFVIYQDRDGVLWVGTWGSGLGRFDSEQGQFTFYTNDPANPNSLGDDSVVTIREDPEGTLWLGTFAAGLVRFDREEEQFVHFANDPNDPQSLSHNTVLSILPDKEGMLWVGTAGGGLDKFDVATGTAVHYTEKDGLANNYVYGILRQEDPPDGSEPDLWLSTNRGLSRFDPETETFRNYDQSDGLQSNEFNQNAYHKGPTGEMYFGGVNGLNAFFPDQVRDNPYVPPVVLTDLTQGGEDASAGTEAHSLDELTLRWPRNFFEFEFAALSYAEPGKNEYAYRLEGFDPDWIDAGGKRFGRYTNLPGGTYTLHIKGSNNDGVWNETGARLAVTVVPPFWQTWWFLGGAALALVAAAVITYRLRVRSVEMRSRELETQVASRTREMAALNTVAAVVNRSLDLHEILGDALAKTLQVTEMESGGIYLLDESSDTLTIFTHQGLTQGLVEAIDRLAVGEGFSGLVVQSGQPIVVEDITQDPRLARMAAREEGYRSLISVPLTSKGKVLGAMFALAHALRGFAEQDIQLLVSIGQQVGVAVENARLFRSEQRRAEQFRLINEVGRRITSMISLDELLEQLIRLVQETLGYQAVSIGLIEGEMLVFQAALGPGGTFVNQPLRLKVGQDSITGWVASTGEALVVPDVSLEPRFVTTPVSPLSRSELALPLKTEAAVIGVLNIESDQPDAFDENDVSILKSLASQAAVAIQKARLLEAERRRADELDALRATMSEITTELELPSLLRAIVERAAGLVDATGGELALYDEASQELRVVVSHNLGEDYAGTRQKLGEGAMGRVAETGESLIIQDYQTWQGRLAHYPQVSATMAAPLMVGGRLVGVFTTATTDPERRFTDADLHRLNLFTQQAAIAIENARLYEQAQQLAVVEERHRLARDLHDSVTQSLYGMTLYSEAAAGQLAIGNEKQVAQHLEELQETAQEALTEMRLLIYELRPPVLEEEGLAAALQARLLSVEERAGLKTKLQVELTDGLRHSIEDGLYRIAQEALNNALKHAHARNIVVRLTQVDGLVTMEIRDDGAGFDPSTVGNRGGVGLSVMQERASELGAQLTVESEPGAGTRVLVEVCA